MSSIQLQSIIAPIPQVRACASFYYVNNAIVINKSYNVASIVRNNPGNYTVNFSKPLDSDSYVTTTGFNRVADADFLQVYSSTKTRLFLEFWSKGATADITTSPGVNFSVVL